LVSVNKQGRVTLPVKARRALGITADTQLEVAVKDGALELRPAFVIPEEDRWAYTPESLASFRRALADVKAGRVFELTENQLLKILRRPRERRRPRARRSGTRT